MVNFILKASDCWIDTKELTDNLNYKKNKNSWTYPGIYILGVKNSKGHILPYYVGQTKDPLRERVRSHAKKIVNPDTTYTIFSEYFLRVIRGTKNDFIQRIPLPSTLYPSSQFGNDILYLNEEHFFLDPKVMNQKIPSLKVGRKHRPLGLLNNPISKSIFDTAVLVQKKVFNSNDSFFFTTIQILDGEEEFVENRNLREIIEAFIKFSLKINVISKSELSFNSLEDYLKLNDIDLNIKCPEIDQEFHPVISRPTVESTILFP